MNHSLLALCQDINIPREIADEVATIDITPMAQYIDSLLSSEKAKITYEHVASLGDDPRGVKMLALQLTAALHSRAIYVQKGISDHIFIDTMKCFTRFVCEHLIQFDHYGFDRGWWTWQQLSLNLFRLGTLEFEMKIKENKNILSVHIPSDAVMTKADLDTSYQWANNFFAEYFPDFKYEGVYCDTWLLAPVLKEMLKPGSKILNFMADYSILSTNPDAKDFMMWVYMKEYPDIDSLPENTSLQRDIKKHLQTGGKVGTALGQYIAN